MQRYLNKRILFKDGTGQLQQGTVLEFSPSGQYVNIWGDWHAIARVTVVEELPDQTPPVPAAGVEAPEAGVTAHERIAAALEEIAHYLAVESKPEAPPERRPTDTVVSTHPETLTPPANT